MQDDQSAEVLYLQLAHSIATPIRAGTLMRGERIPSVRELARSRAVSIGTVLQAYRMLEDAHLIEARPRSGYFVGRRACLNRRHQIRRQIPWRWTSVRSRRE
jgi:DNA-binding transcriptional regulator YhcF (GntR family)